MQTLYFVLMVACVGWLMLWAALPEHGEDGLWWPFAMKENEAAPADEAADATQAAGQGASSWRERAARTAAADRARHHARGRHPS